MSDFEKPRRTSITDWPIRAGLAVVMAIGSGCAGQSFPGSGNGPGTAVPGSLAAQSVELPFARNLRIAEEAPGYGGFFRDPGTGRYFVFSSIEENDEVILAAWRRHVGVNAEAVVLRGMYDFRQLNSWYGEVVNEAWGLLTIHGFADQTNQILFGVHDEAALLQLWRVLDVLGVPREAVRADVAPILVG